MNQADVRKQSGGRLRLYLAPLLIFLSSRVVIIFGVLFAANFLPTNREASSWDATTAWYRHLLRYDSGWYLRIVKEGYSYDGNNLIEQPVVFYPLYPLLSRLLSSFGISEAAAVLLVSNLSILVAVLLFFKLVREDYETETALYAVALVSFFPSSLFFSAGYTEALSFLLIVCFFLYLKRERFFVAACFAGLTFATRSTGLALLAPLLWEISRRYWRTDRKRLLLKALACSVIATSGLWLYMLYLWAAFRDPLAFMSGQVAWNAGKSTGNALLLVPFKALGDIVRVGFVPNSISPWLFLLFVALLVVFRKRVPVSFILYTAGVLILPYLAFSGTQGFISFTRYILLAFPVFIITGDLCRGRIWLALPLACVSAALLFMYTALFAEWYWVG